MQKRGVVIASACDAFVNDDGQFMVRAPHLDPTLFRTSLLYWDRIDVPDGGVVKVELPREFEPLVTEGILSRTDVGTILPEGLARLSSINPRAASYSHDVLTHGAASKLLTAINDAPLLALDERGKDEDILWAYFANDPRQKAVPQEERPDRVFLFEMYRALPIPESHLPFDKILEFKAKRRAELLALRTEIDRIYQELQGAKDIEHAKSMAFARLEAVLLDLASVAKEGLRIRLARSLKFEINPVGMVAAAGLAAGTGSAIAGSLLALTSCFRLDFSTRQHTKELHDRLTPYRYLLNTHEELNADLGQ